MSTGVVARPPSGTQQTGTRQTGRRPGAQQPGALPPSSSAVQQRKGPGVLRRIGGLRRTSPGRLQLIMAALLLLGLLAGLFAGLTGYATRSGTSDLGGRAQPLLVEAETIYSALADADTTAAQAFLAGGLEPTDLTNRYDDDLTRATTALTSAARRTPDGSDSGESVRALSSGVAKYAELVATARATNRQGLPVGASYLAAASRLNRDTLLPQAQSLFGVAQREVDGGFGSAISAGMVFLFALLLLALLATLIWAQRYLSRSTNRTFNLPLVTATGLTVLLGVVAGGILVAQNSHLGKAARNGSDPIETLAESRILALKLRGDEALTLAARGSDATREQEYQTGAQQLKRDGGPLRNDTYDSIDPALGRTTEQAVRDFTAYDDLHTQVRKLDDNGDYDGAVKLAIGTKTTTAFEAVRADLDTALTDRKAVFTDEIGAAGRGLGLLAVLGPVLALIICALAAAGIRTRLEEYR